MSRDLFEELHLRRVVNASGTLTAYGQSSALPAVVEAMAAALPHFFEMDVLHARASAAIAQVTGAEAGFVTSCAAAGITIAIAACMAGVDPARIAALPATDGMQDEVIIQLGHCVDYGAPVTQGIRLAGARVKTIGTVNGTARSLLAASFSPQTVAAVYVASHHTVQYGAIPFPQFVATAHDHGVPVVVDAAAEESQLRSLLDAGADLVICSGHKHFRGPTSGVMAGRLELIRAAYAQNRGIGRHMKVGKEGLVGLIVALEAWASEGRAAVVEQEKRRMERLVEQLRGLPGIQATTLWPEPDPYPIMRAKITVDQAQAGLNAMALSVLLARGDPSVRVRAHHVDEGYFLIDPFTLTDAEARFVGERIVELVNAPQTEKAALMAELAGMSAADLRTGKNEWPYL
ncbi:MAG TPA: aminotransferase class V-fold PLP-dependent enzyme [Caldilineaceae bacterium]|nr:aminotransferase class V-fold PLP-dependent enzyme [Caldilineaceae bacterium]